MTSLGGSFTVSNDGAHFAAEMTLRVSGTTTLTVTVEQIVNSNLAKKQGLTDSIVTDYDFSISKNIKGLHVLFQPEVKTDGSGLRQKTFITGCSVQEAPKNDVDTTKPANSGSNGGGNGGSTQPSTGGNGGGSHEPIGD